MISLIAQSPFANPPSEGIDIAPFMLLVIFGVVYAAIHVLGRVLENLEYSVGSTILDVAFALLLVLGGYSVVLFVISIVGEPGLIADLFEVVLIVIAFFALLIVALLLIEQAVGSLSRKRRRSG